MRKVFIVDSSAVLRSIEKKIAQLTSNLEVVGESSDVRDILNIPNKFVDFIFIEASEKNIVEIEKILLRKSKISASLILLTQGKVDILQSYKGLYIWECPDLLSCSSEKLQEIAQVVENKLNYIKTSSMFFRKGGKTTDKARGTAGDLSCKCSAVSAVKKENNKNNYKVVLVGVSTGGPGAILKLLDSIGKNFPLPILITQHIDSSFEKNLTEWLQKSVNMPVHVAKNGIKPLPGHVYFAPADYHMVVSKNLRGEMLIRLNTDPPVNFLRPSVDKLFLSGAEVLQSNVISVLLTGMGADGANGSCVLKENGAYTIGENEETCVVYGMPKAAYDMGGITELLPLYKIGDRLKKLVGSENSYGRKI